MMMPMREPTIDELRARLIRLRRSESQPIDARRTIARLSERLISSYCELNHAKNQNLGVNMIERGNRLFVAMVWVAAASWVGLACFVAAVYDK